MTQSSNNYAMATAKNPIDEFLDTDDTSTLVESDSSDSTIVNEQQNPLPLSKIMNFKKPPPAIEHWYDMKEWKVGEKFSCRVSFIFDVSKFYIVTMHKETDALQSYIHNWYMQKYEEYLIPSSDVKRGMYCIVYSDTSYYRGYITKIPQVSNDPMALVYLLDFGYTILSTFDCLFYMTEDLYTVPMFAIRALLSNVQPYNTALWSSKAVKKFEELVMGEVLTGMVTANHAEEKTLYVKLFRADKQTYVVNIAAALSRLRLATPVKKKGDIVSILDQKRKVTKVGAFFSKLRFPFLFPSHEDIENGTIPYDFISFQILTQVPGNEKLLSTYFHYTE